MTVIAIVVALLVAWAIFRAFMSLMAAVIRVAVVGIVLVAVAKCDIEREREAGHRHERPRHTMMSR